jgi:hypothetical protein
VKRAALASLMLAGAIVGGFLVGLAWGRGTREAIPDSTETDFSGGVLTVRVDTRRAIESGLLSLLR